MASSPKPIPDGRPRFRDVALRSRLLTEQQLDLAESELRIAMSGPDAAAEAWDRSVADIHVRKRELTKFQARELLAGRSRFHLGPYVVFDELGRGGMGQVFKAEHLFMGRHVAIKVLPRAKSTPESEAAFQREMRILGRLQHENIVQALDAGYDAMVYYLVTELVSGLDLRKQVLKYGSLSDGAAASVISQAAQGLAYAHTQGIVHRDVKPGNLLVRKDGRVKVLDLGLAGSMLEDESMKLGRVVGTMDYIAPEQIRSADTVGPTADIYALGCTLYFALSGQRPFPGGTAKEKQQRHLHDTPRPLRDIAASVSADMARLVEAMMRKSAADRIQSMAEVVERLRPWTDHGVVAMPRSVEMVESGFTPLEEDDLPGTSSVPSLEPWSPSQPASAPLGKGFSVVGETAARLSTALAASPWVRGFGGVVASGLLLSFAAGLAFTICFLLVRTFAAGVYGLLLGNASPLTLGVGAGLMMLVLQFITGVSGFAGNARR